MVLFLFFSYSLAVLVFQQELILNYRDQRVYYKYKVLETVSVFIFLASHAAVVAMLLQWMDCRAGLDGNALLNVATVTASGTESKSPSWPRTDSVDRVCGDRAAFSIL